MNQFKRPGDEATQLDAGTLGWSADNEAIRLARQNDDSICARAILLGVHESLAKAIASVTPQEQERILSAIDREIAARSQATDSCTVRDQSLVIAELQGWAAEVRERVGFHSTS